MAHLIRIVVNVPRSSHIAGKAGRETLCERPCQCALNVTNQPQRVPQPSIRRLGMVR
jgi:hypothetical protein